jgi:hypothetical protein
MVQYNHITQLISELLFKNDCVIVPNLGGFVAQSYPSHFSNGSSLLLPPTKQILFNKNLKHNDGLLVSSYSEKFDLGYALASAQIEDYKEYIVSLLVAKKRFELLNLGLLYIDLDNEIRFESKIDVNFLIDSFGFEPVIAKEIEKVGEPFLNKTVFEDRKINTINKSSRKYSVKQMALLAVGLPITITMLVFAANSKPLEPIMHSSLNPFYNSPQSYSKLNNREHKSFFLDKISLVSLIEDNNGNATFKLSEEGITLIASNKELVVIKDSENTNAIIHTTNISANYQVVVGCFGIESNASKLIKELKSKNINASISGINAKGLHVVSCGGFNTKSEANVLVNSLKSEFPNAWVMEK